MCGNMINAMETDGNMMRSNMMGSNMMDRLRMGYIFSSGSCNKLNYENKKVISLSCIYFYSFSLEIYFEGVARGPISLTLIFLIFFYSDCQR